MLEIQFGGAWTLSIGAQSEMLTTAQDQEYRNALSI